MNSEVLFDDIRKIVTRRPIPPGQITLYKVLYEESGKWLSNNKLSEKMRWNDKESLRGVLGALGNRVNRTNGLSTDMQGIEVLLETDEENDSSSYRMRSELREVIDREPKLREAIILSVPEIHERFKNKKDWLKI
uniref:Uncharacterized protein n=1 Tax=Cyanothece sp. (strain PCC 7425 / ATCC 29141) TaxID=395961 RepID=B8HP62_CYAP4